MSNIVEVPLDFSHLSHLEEGRINKLLENHLRAICVDCMNRPGDKTKRKVTLEFFAQPRTDDQGFADTALVQIECKSKVPMYRSRPLQMRLTNKGFTYNQDFPDDINQPSLFPEEGEQPE